jgi:hypothetical protein
LLASIGSPARQRESRSEDAFFRTNAGACVIDSEGGVLALKRRGVADIAWQMPQSRRAARSARENPSAAPASSGRHPAIRRGSSSTRTRRFRHPERMRGIAALRSVGIPRLISRRIARIAFAMFRTGELFDANRLTPPKNLTATMEPRNDDRRHALTGRLGMSRRFARLDTGRFTGYGPCATVPERGTAALIGIALGVLSVLSGKRTASSGA